MLGLFSDGTAIPKVGVPALEIFVRNNAGRKHSALKGDGVDTRQNTGNFEFSSGAVITDAAAFSFAANEMKFAVSTAHDSKPNWHLVIMLREEASIEKRG